MATGTPWWRRLGRQVVPRHSGQDCCWYHAIDWHAVSKTAIRLVRQDQRAGIDVDAIAEHVLDQAQAQGMAGREMEALSSLVSLGEGIMPSGDRTVPYINGQHRAQAMLDAGVRRTLVIRCDLADELATSGTPSIPRP